MNNIFIILSSVFIAFLIFGFLWGMFRSWKKSLIRFGILIVDFIIALFCAPPISKTIIKAITHGTTVSIFNINLDVSKMFQELVGADMAGDLVYAQDTTNELATAFINVVINLIVFLLAFIALWLISLIIYGIVFSIIKHSKKEENKEKKHENIGLRFIGGFVGLLSMCVIFFAFLIPVFGAMTICNNFIEENSKSKKASAISPSSYISGQLYYKEDEKIGTVETYIEKYNDVKTAYDKSIIGGFFNVFGLSKLGGTSFGYLTNVSAGELSVNFTNEAVYLISTYNAYKETFIANKFNIEDNKSVDRFISIYDNASKSVIAQNYIIDLVPVATENWLDESGQKTFLGIKNPIPDDFKPIFNPLLNVFNARNFNKIDRNTRVLLNMVKIANNNNFISMVNNAGGKENSLVDYFCDNKTFFKDTILELSKTEEFRDNLPVTFNELLKKLYNLMVGGENPIPNLPKDQVINWEFEANNIQSTMNDLMAFYKTAETTNGDALIDELGRVGRIIDYARKSTMLSESYKQFIIGYLNSDKVNFGEKNTEIKLEITTHIENKWSYKDNPNFSFESAFGAIAETYKVVKNLEANAESVNLNDLKTVLKDIVKDEESKTLILEVLNSNLTNETLGTSDSAVVVKDILLEFTEHSTEATIEQDIVAGQKVIEIVDASKNDGGQLNLTKDESDNFVESVTASNSIMNILEKSSTNKETGQDDKLATMIGDIDSTSKANIVSSVNNNTEISEKNKKILLNLFA